MIAPYKINFKTEPTNWNEIIEIFLNLNPIIRLNLTDKELHRFTECLIDYLNTQKSINDLDLKIASTEPQNGPNSVKLSTLTKMRELKHNYRDLLINTIKREFPKLEPEINQIPYINLNNPQSLLSDLPIAPRSYKAADGTVILFCETNSVSAKYHYEKTENMQEIVNYKIQKFIKGYNLKIKNLAQHKTELEEIGFVPIIQ